MLNFIHIQSYPENVRIWINPEHIESFELDMSGDFTCVMFSSGAELTIKESPAELLELIGLSA